jgi:O-antigen ligase
MENFWMTQYGMLAERAAAMTIGHPLFGFGFDGFRDECANPIWFGGVPWLHIAGTSNPLACTIHPHNYWLQVATSTGFPGLVLFAALAIVWLWRIGQPLRGAPTSLQIALFVSACTILWPIASTTALFTVPNAGWLFLLIGWGLAEARPASARPT